MAVPQSILNFFRFQTEAEGVKMSDRTLPGVIAHVCGNYELLMALKSLDARDIPETKRIKDKIHTILWNLIGDIAIENRESILATIKRVH